MKLQQNEKFQENVQQPSRKIFRKIIVVVDVAAVLCAFDSVAVVQFTVFSFVSVISLCNS